MDGLSVIRDVDITYLEKQIFKDNKFQFLSYKFYKDIPENDIKLFCYKHAIYCLPTIELVEWIREQIDGKYTIEIGSGNGYLAKELGIKATDSFLQDRPDIQLKYKLMKQPTIKYGDNVQRMSANEAVKFYQPKIVLGVWVTHLYDFREHWREGNAYGIDEEHIVRNCSKYIFIGSEKTHKLKPIHNLNKTTYKPEWLVSRNCDDSDVIWIWERRYII